jgi:hypothetical protein
MSSSPTRPRWFFLVTPRWLAWHAFAIGASAGMLWLGEWQFSRAEGGNALSWAYTFEWPVFALFGLVFWVKTIVDAFRPPADPGLVPEVDLPASATGGGGMSTALVLWEPPDPELDAYNAYLAQLNQQHQHHDAARQSHGRP